MDTLVQKSTKINTLEDYKKSLENPMSQKLIPGYTRMVETTFKFNNKDLPYETFKEYNSRKEIDYGPLLLQEKFLKVFNKRLEDYDKTMLDQIS